MAHISTAAEIIHGPLISTALRRVLFYQGGDGFVATMAQSLHARRHRRRGYGVSGRCDRKITGNDARGTLDGKRPDESDIPICRFDEFKRGSAILSRCHGIAMDLPPAQTAVNGYGCGCDYGIDGDAGVTGVGRYVAVAPRDVSTIARYESSEVRCSPR